MNRLKDVIYLILQGVVLVVLSSSPAEGFADGAPVEACIFKGPNHPPTKSLPPDTLPHKFVADKGSYKPGDKIEVYVNGPKVKGFFIQAIDDNYKPIGSWVKNDYSKLHDECSAITHSHPGPKKDLSFIWKAPSHGGHGNVYFRATIMEEYDKYWSKVFAKVLRPNKF